MKHNLANRPDKDLIAPTLENWIHWANGFEKELQRLKQDYDKTFHCLIDEILGVTNNE